MVHKLERWAQESDPECWDQLCGDGREDESEDGVIQDGGQIVKDAQEEASVSSHGIFVSRLSLFNFCLIDFGMLPQNVSNNFKFQSFAERQDGKRSWKPDGQLHRFRGGRDG